MMHGRGKMGAAPATTAQVYFGACTFIMLPASLLCCLRVGAASEFIFLFLFFYGFTLTGADSCQTRPVAETD